MVATSPPTTATINARNWIHAPTTGTHRHGNRATTVAATTRITRPGGTVGTSIPENIWIANPKAATRRAATVTLLAEDKELGRFIAFLLSVVVNDLAFRGVFRRARSDHHLASATSSGAPIRPSGNDAARCI